MRRIIACFDPAVDGFLRRMLRLLGLALAGLGLLGCLGLLALGRRFEPEIRYWVGVTELQSGRNAAALRSAQRLVADDPDRSWYDHRLLATALRREGRVEEQLAVIEAAAERFPDSWRAQADHCWYGTLFGDPAEVLGACDRAVDLVPEGRGNGHSRRGVARALTGDREGAIADLREAISRWESHGRGGDAIELRKAWLEALEAGEQPIDEATLEALRRQF